MEDVYKNCPQYENEHYILRMVSKEDTLDLLKVYSDKMAVPFFNSDNCNGDDFYYTTESRMEQAIDFWLFAYNSAGFVRWSILSKVTDEAIGTIEQIATKAISRATERIKALKQLGFEDTDEKLIGHDGTRYDSYFVLNRN